MSSDLERNIPTDFEKYKYIRDKLVEEAKYRRDRQWNVFSWVSTLLVGIIGGVIALNGNDFIFSIYHKIAISVAAVGLAAVAYVRMRHDAHVALAYTKVIFKLDEQQKLKFTDRKHKKWHLGNIGFTVLLMLAALFAIWSPTPEVAPKQPQPANQPSESRRQ
jgi:hypothetical protein